jgi:predicted ester cyclase
MDDLAARRAAVVREHMESENRHDFDATIATFAHPRYELIGTGDVYDGEAEVRGYFEETRTAFPDQRNRLVALYHAVDAVMVELVLEGTHTGPLRGLPPTGRAFTAQRPDRVRAGVLRRGDDPAPARAGVRSADAARAARDRGDASGDGRVGGAAQPVQVMSALATSGSAGGMSNFFSISSCRP